MYVCIWFESVMVIFIDDRDEWQERVREICASCTT